jgi:purine-binding chemotaxis protein CheW
MLIRGVRSAGKITPVPGVPSFYPGVVNIRGQIVTVLDLRVLFGLEIDRRDVPDEMIVVQSGRLELGLLAHHVRGVVNIPAAAVEPLDEVRYARGITGDRLVLLDVPRLFEDERLIVGGIED